MLFKSSGVDHDVINVDLETMAYHVPEHVVHDTLECSRSIAEPKWHLVVLVATKGGNKCGSDLGLLGYSNLVKSTEEIQGGEPLGVSSHLFKCPGGSWEGMGILDSNGIETLVIDDQPWGGFSIDSFLDNN